MVNKDYGMEVMALQKDFEHLLEKVERVEEIITCHDNLIYELQNAKLLQPSQTREIALQVIAEYTKTKTVRVQAYAPYVVALIMTAGVIIAAVLK